MGRTDSWSDWLLDLPCPLDIRCSTVADPIEHDSPQWALVPAETTLWICRFGTYQVVLCCGLQLAFGYVGYGASWESISVGHIQPLPMFGLGLPGSVYKVICDHLLVAACAGPGGT